MGLTTVVSATLILVRIEMTNNQDKTNAHLAEIVSLLKKLNRNLSKSATAEYSEGILDKLALKRTLDTNQVAFLTKSQFSKVTLIQFMRKIAYENQDIMYISGRGQEPSKLYVLNDQEIQILNSIQKGKAIQTIELREKLKLSEEDYPDFMKTIRQGVLFKCGELYMDYDVLHRRI